MKGRRRSRPSETIGKPRTTGRSTTEPNASAGPRAPGLVSILCPSPADSGTFQRTSPGRSVWLIEFSTASRSLRPTRGRFPIGSNPRFPVGTPEQFADYAARVKHHAQESGRDPSALDFAYSVNWLNDQQARRYPMASAAL
jgi:hypothetical protein